MNDKIAKYNGLKTKIKKIRKQKFKIDCELSELVFEEEQLRIELFTESKEYYNAELFKLDFKILDLIYDLKLKEAYLVYLEAKRKLIRKRIEKEVEKHE